MGVGGGQLLQLRRENLILVSSVQYGMMLNLEGSNVLQTLVKMVHLVMIVKHDQR